MFWLLLNIALLTIAYLVPCGDVTIEDGYDLSRKHRKRICVVGSLGWILLASLRNLSVGADTRNYKNMFERIEKMSWRNIFDSFYEGYFGEVESSRDPGYRILTKVIQVFVSDYRWFMVLLAVFFFITLGVFLFKFSRNPYISYVLFSCLFYSFYAFTGYRQTIATAFVVLMGSFFIKKRKLFPFLIIVLIASTIHLSCLCFLPVYFLVRIPINKATMIVYWIAIGCSFLFRYQLLEFLKSIVGYEQYNDFEGAGVGIFMILLLLVAVVVTLFQKKLLASNPGTMPITIHTLMTACFFVSLALINQSCMRVVYYFALFLMLLLPELGQIFAKKSDKKFYNLAATALLIILLVINEPTYEFMWQ